MSKIKVNEIAKHDASEITISDTIKIDTIAEKTSAAGVTIDGVLLKDGNLVNGTDFSCQQFRLTTNNTTGGDITSGWEAPDGTLHGNFGSNVSESSGIYTFAKTGFYKVSFWGTIHSSNEIETDIRIMVSTDAFSSVDTEAALATQRIQPSDDGSTVTTSCILDITDLSNHKVKFKWSELVGSATLVGNTGYNRTFVEFMRLGDT